MRRFLLLLLAAAPLIVTSSPARAEEPVHVVIESLDAGVEIREYAPMLVAEVEVPTGDFEAAGATGFRPLADFIFGGNDRGERIGMTAPVKQAADGARWRIGFVMPARYSLATLPKPRDARVRIVEVPRRFVAAIRFSGRWSNVRYAEHWRLLKREIDAAGWQPNGEPQAAQYDAPWVPGPLRRNEILVPVRRRG